MVERLAMSLDAREYEIEACFLRYGEFTARFRALGIKSTCVDWNGAPTSPVGAAKYARLLRSGKYNLIHQHTGGRFLTKMGRIFTSAKILRHVHGRAAEGTGEIPLTLHLPKTDAIIATSRSVAEACCSPTVKVIYPGIDANEFLPARNPGQRPVVGTACRLEPVKAIPTLIEAIAILAAQDPRIHVEIAGEGSLKPELEEHVARLGLSENIAFLGWRRNMASVLQSWSVFVQPSLDEGFGLAALEAMASGLAVVASDVGGLRELVEDGKTGFLIPSRAPAELAAKIRLLLDDPDLATKMGTAGRQRAQEHFPISATVRKTLDLYSSLLEPARNSRLTQPSARVKP